MMSSGLYLEHPDQQMVHLSRSSAYLKYLCTSEPDRPIIWERRRMIALVVPMSQEEIWQRCHMRCIRYIQWSARVEEIDCRQTETQEEKGKQPSKPGPAPKRENTATPPSAQMTMRFRACNEDSETESCCEVCHRPPGETAGR